MINLLKLFMNIFLLLQGPTIPGRTGAGGIAPAGTWSLVARGSIVDGTISSPTRQTGFSVNPAAHETIVGCLMTAFTPTGTITITDENSNVYTISAGSPAHQTTANFYVYMFYVLNAGASMGKFVTANWTSGTGYAMMTAIRFNDSNTGGAALRGDAASGATDVSDASTGAVGTPSITNTGGDLLMACAIANATMTAPKLNNTQNGWTGSGLQLNGVLFQGNGGEYILSGPGGSQAVSYTDNTNSDPYASMAIAFKP